MKKASVGLMLFIAAGLGLYGLHRQDEQKALQASLETEKNRQIEDALDAMLHEMEQVTFDEVHAPEDTSDNHLRRFIFKAFEPQLQRDFKDYDFSYVDQRDSAELNNGMLQVKLKTAPEKSYPLRLCVF